MQLSLTELNRNRKNSEVIVLREDKKALNYESVHFKLLIY